MITIFRPVHHTKTGFRVVDGVGHPDMKGFTKREMDASSAALELSDEEFKAWAFLGQECNCVDHGPQDPIVLADAILEVLS